MNEFFARCKICKKETEIEKQPEDPKSSIGCYISFCPDCENKANDYWQITSYIYKDRQKSQSKNKDQMKLFYDNVSGGALNGTQ